MPLNRDFQGCQPLGRHEQGLSRNQIVGLAVNEQHGRTRPQRKARQGQLIDTADPAKAAAELVTALRQAGVL